jgi:RNA polymerase sigma-70 factor (ECF subfamily)
VIEDEIAMASAEPDTEELLQRATDGQLVARSQLLERHRQRLRRMIALRLDRRVAPRVDPSDVLQDSLAEAVEQMSDYLRRRPLPFYPWLRQIAWQRIVDIHRRHLRARKRSVLREEDVVVSDGSAFQLAGRLFGRSSSSPSARLRRRELGDLVRRALLQLSEKNREVLMLRYLEQLAPGEIAAILGTSEGAVSMRHARALQQLRVILGEVLGENEP